MMMHVVNNLCAFLMFEVLETSWQSLQETIGRAKCLDDVITAHDAYLTEVLDRALLAPHHEGLNMQVQQLLHIVLRFCALEENLIAGRYLMCTILPAPVSWERHHRNKLEENSVYNC
jgi:gamma-tubulin complex component 3